MEGLEHSLVKEGWGWIDGQGAQMWRAGTAASRQSLGHALVKLASMSLECSCTRAIEQPGPARPGPARPGPASV